MFIGCWPVAMLGHHNASAGGRARPGIGGRVAAQGAGTGRDVQYEQIADETVDFGDLGSLPGAGAPGVPT